MQSQARKLRRINNGIQNPVPVSTKIAKQTEGVSPGMLRSYRTKRFLKSVAQVPAVFIKNLSVKSWREKNIA